MKRVISFSILTSIFFVVNAEILWEKYPVPFYEGMSHSKFFNRRSAAENPRWQTFRKLYDRGMRSTYSRQNGSRIPQVFHLIWLGSAVPAYYYTLQKRLEDLHPKYTVRLWTDADARQFPMLKRQAFDAAVNQGERSDIFRYEILHAQGGVYLDGDFQVLKSFDELLYACDFFVGIAYPEVPELYNSIIGSAAGHPIIKRCLDALQSGRIKHDIDTILNRSGPLHLTRCFFQVAESCKSIMIPFPVAFFYPWPNYERTHKSSRRLKDWVKSYSLALHEWNCSWITKSL